ELIRQPLKARLLEQFNEAPEVAYGSASHPANVRNRGADCLKPLLERRVLSNITQVLKVLGEGAQEPFLHLRPDGLTEIAELRVDSIRCPQEVVAQDHAELLSLAHVAAQPFRAITHDVDESSAFAIESLE